VIAALIALIGTLIVAVIGYRRWDKERQAQRFSRFESDKQDVYKTLWDRVQNVNASLRRGRVDASGFSELVADLNEFMIRNGAHLDDADQQLVNEYIAAVRSFHEVVSGADSEAQILMGRRKRFHRKLPTALDISARPNNKPIASGTNSGKRFASSSGARFRVSMQRLGCRAHEAHHGIQDGSDRASRPPPPARTRVARFARPTTSTGL